MAGSADSEYRKTKNCTLAYEGKMSEDDIFTSIPDIEFECQQSSLEGGFQNSIFKGDNLLVMNKLLEILRGKIDLVYIDPPFGTNQDYLDYDGKKAYSDKVTNQTFLEFIRKRLFLIRELMSDKGSIYLHIDKKMSHYVKLLMDEVFGEDNFINEITRIKCNPKNFNRKAYGNYSDTILFYTKVRDSNIWNDSNITLLEEEIERAFPKIDAQGRRYTTTPLHAPGVTENGATGEMWNGMYPPAGRHWRYSPQVLTELNEAGLIEWSSSGNPRKIIYADDHHGKKPQDIWEFKDKGMKYSRYPTEKNNDMLEFIIRNSSDEGSLVLDCFAGSFAALYEAYKLNRKFIGIDYSDFAIEAGRKLFEENNIPYNYYEAR